jgi:thiosulfate dehydrogenase
MALLFQPRARAVRVLTFAVLGAGAAASAVHGQPPPAPAARAATATSLVPDASPASPAASAAPAAAAADSPGAKLYSMACATCHMPDGSGVPGMQPALMGSKVVAGPAATLIKVLLLGPEKALPAHKATGGNQMPQFDSLSDEDIASILTYVRKTFGKGASAVTPAQVKAHRPK